MAEHNILGHKGELQAIDYLQEQGYTILEKNYRYLKAEVDIIAQKDGYLIGIEVKTRSSDYFGNPQEFVNKKKINLMVQALDYYINSKDIDLDIRFDIIAIIYNQNDFRIEHIEDAFLYF